MPVPDFQSLMLPVLDSLREGVETSVPEIRAHVASALELTSDDLREVIPSGRQSTLANRVAWGLVYMQRAGLIDRVRRGVYRLTSEGDQLLSDAPGRVDLDRLQSYPAYRKWRAEAGSRKRTTDATDAEPQGKEPTATPDEALARVVVELRETLQAELLDRIRVAPPAFLERVVVDLLIAMGYGGGDAAMGRVTGRSGDGGIDGTIREDALGLDEIYVQAKRYTDGAAVGEADLRNFAGAIDAAGTTKGVFVTTAGFTAAAKSYVARSPKRIVLIDGTDLARLMVEHGVGVRMRAHYKVRRVDEDYFDEGTA